MCPCFADLFSCVHGVSASPRAARASALRARGGGLAWAQLIASLFCYSILRSYVTCVVAMHCVVPSARLTHVCTHIMVFATSDCSCGLTRARRRALVSTAAQ